MGSVWFDVFEWGFCGRLFWASSNSSVGMWLRVFDIQNNFFTNPRAPFPLLPQWVFVDDFSALGIARGRVRCREGVKVMAGEGSSSGTKRKRRGTRAQEQPADTPLREVEYRDDGITHGQTLED
ncbi:hypothetical protein Hanom_Chr07g00612621 [Helianthus anomalus]